MKYIRTKDCIYKVVLVSPLGFVRIDKRDGTFPDIFEKDIINQADTIEELCDGLIVEDKNNASLWFVMEMDEFKNEKEHLTGWNYNAFIKTDKGLIYVAKMNDKGELELL